MADNSTILEKLDGLVARFEEISTLITDPAVIADQKRYVKLTKEYKELDDLMKARKEYMQLLGNIEEARNILANESDADMREMAKEEMDSSQERLPVLEEEIKLMLVPADPQDSKNAILEIRGGTGEIASRIMPDVFYDLDAPIQRMGTADVPLPFSPALEFPLIPDEKKIAAKIREMV